MSWFYTFTAGNQLSFIKQNFLHQYKTKRWIAFQRCNAGSWSIPFLSFVIIDWRAQSTKIITQMCILYRFLFTPLHQSNHAFSPPAKGVKELQIELLNSHTISCLEKAIHSGQAKPQGISLMGSGEALIIHVPVLGGVDELPNGFLEKEI